VDTPICNVNLPFVAVDANPGIDKVLLRNLVELATKEDAAMGYPAHKLAHDVLASVLIPSEGEGVQALRSTRKTTSHLSDEEARAIKQEISKRSVELKR
jgi:hypothetical protein